MRMAIAASLVLCATTSLAQEAASPPSPAQVWVNVNEKELESRIFAVTAEDRHDTGDWIARCRVGEGDDAGPVWFELGHDEDGMLVLWRRTLVEQRWLTAVKRAESEGVPLDLDAMVRRIAIDESRVDQRECPKLTDLLARSRRMTIPLFAGGASFRGQQAQCAFRSLAGTRVQIALFPGDAQSEWHPFLEWMHDMVAVCPKRRGHEPGAESPRRGGGHDSTSKGDCFALAAQAAAADAPAWPAEGRIRAHLEVPPTPDPRGSQLQVRVELTCVDHCPVFIDTCFSGAPTGNRPFTIVWFTVWNEKGEKIEPRDLLFPDVTGFRPHEVLPLWDTWVFGIDFDLGLFPWKLTLPPGRYRIQAQLWFPMRSFIEKREDLVAAFSTMFGGGREAVLSRAAHGTVTTNEITVDVR